MLNVVKTKIEMDNDLRKKLEFICSFCNVKPIIFNGHIIQIENTNISYVEPLQLYSQELDRTQNEIQKNDLKIKVLNLQLNKLKKKSQKK